MLQNYRAFLLKWMFLYGVFVKYNTFFISYFRYSTSLNSVKSNRLPQWDPFFDRFSENQFILYQLIQEKPAIHKLYEGCWRDNLHSIWAGQELYRPGNTRETFSSILQSNMRPVYDSARRQGYEIWKIM